MYLCQTLSDYLITGEFEEFLLFQNLGTQARHLQLCPRVALAPHWQMDQHRRSWTCLVSDVRRQESSGGCHPQSKVWCCEVSGDEFRSALSLQPNKLQHLPLQSTWLLSQASLPSFWKETILCINESIGLVGVGPPSHHSSSCRDPKQNVASADFALLAASDLHFLGAKHGDAGSIHLCHMKYGSAHMCRRSWTDLARLQTPSRCDWDGL